MSQGFYAVFAEWAKKHGLAAAFERFVSGLGVDATRELEARFKDDLAKIESGGPAIIAAGHVPWYAGPTDGSIYWPPLREFFVRDKWPDDRIANLDHSSNMVVAHTPAPSTKKFDSKGLVVGFVQSGKTTNFLSVIAKLADEDYGLVIVLSGIHNGLRKQTQLRLQSQLQDPLPTKWHLLTTEERDFQIPTNSPLATLSEERVALAIVKKNAAVLRRLIKWLDTQAGRQALEKCRVLIVDDEADQASVATKSINPLIMKLLALTPRHTYIGYTATPFANVFIDPAADDLYPADFILNLPRPEGYFGPEKIFGRNVVEGEDDEAAPDGYDMIRIVPESDVGKLRPVGASAAATFAPTMTDDLRDAVRWFWLATAARRARGDDAAHSTMLIHTAVNIGVHEALRAPLESLRAATIKDLSSPDTALMHDLRSLWTEETSRVPADDWGRSPTPFDSLLAHLPSVVDETQIILDNSRSGDRLVYPDDKAIVAIAVGGNTLSRGLTLEGLVVSFFVRSANAYDTLLQMGRWFGFRHGYEDLPRIWMTESLRAAFRHLATVEQEMRDDIDYYQRQDLTPRDVAVRIRTHPSLRITAKMGAAMPAYISFAGRRLQTRFFFADDGSWLRQNLEAADNLVSSMANVEKVDSGLLFRDVPARLILNFLDQYQVHGDSPDIDPALMKKYIEKQISEATPSLTTWSVAVVAAGGDDVNLGGHLVGSVIRSRLSSDDARADIKTLMSKQDRVIDLPITSAEAKGLAEEKLMRLRNDDPIHHNRGLLVIYPIDRTSNPISSADDRVRVPLNAVETVIGIGLVFPGEAESGTRVAATHVAVDLTDVAEPDLEAIEDDTEEAD